MTVLVAAVAAIAGLGAPLAGASIAIRPVTPGKPWLRLEARRGGVVRGAFVVANAERSPQRLRLYAVDATVDYASFLNRIECHFWAIAEFVVKNADYPDWNTLAKAMADHITYRNGPHRDQRLIKAERRLLIAA